MYDVSCGFIIYGFYYVELYLFYIQFIESFYYKFVLNLVKYFLFIYWDDHMVFILHF